MPIEQSTPKEVFFAVPEVHEDDAPTVGERMASMRAAMPEEIRRHLGEATSTVQDGMRYFRFPDASHDGKNIIVEGNVLFSVDEFRQAVEALGGSVQ